MKKQKDKVFTLVRRDTFVIQDDGSIDWGMGECSIENRKRKKLNMSDYPSERRLQLLKELAVTL